MPSINYKPEARVLYFDIYSVFRNKCDRFSGEVNYLCVIPKGALRAIRNKYNTPLWMIIDYLNTKTTEGVFPIELLQNIDPEVRQE